MLSTIGIGYSSTNKDKVIRWVERKLSSIGFYMSGLVHYKDGLTILYFEDEFNINIEVTIKKKGNVFSTII